MISLLLSSMLVQENPLLTPPTTPVHIEGSLEHSTTTAPLPMQELRKIPEPDLATLPQIDAKAVLLMEPVSGTVLYESNANERLPIASLTKIMTAVVAMEHYQLSDVLTVPDDARTVEGTKMWLYGDELLTVYQLLQGALIVSGNDAALTLAHHMGYDAFIGFMNHKAKQLNLSNTRFSNPVGLDEETNYSTARDLAHLTRYALRSPTFRDIVRVESVSISSVSGIAHQLDTTNQLFETDLFIKGVKTGTTPLALECLVSLTEGADGRQLLLVVLGSTSRYQTSEALLEWGFQSR